MNYGYGKTAVGQGGMFYDVQSAHPLSSTNQSPRAHPWPNLVETAGTQEATDWAKKNALYLAGGGLVVAGLAAWHFGWFK